MNRVAGAGALMVLALSSCGSEPLSDADENAVIRAVGDISFYCPHAAAPKRPAPPHIVRGVERLIAIHHKDPDALHLAYHEEEKSTMSEVLRGAERQVRWCDPRLADRIER